MDASQGLPGLAFGGAARSVAMLACLAASLLTGCEADTSGTDRFGRTYYIDGAGNWGYGVAEVQHGLRKAGYQGSIINYRWSPTLNPALDQTIGRLAAWVKGVELGRRINSYNADYPGCHVNIICLSAGSGVGIWACEAVEPPAKVHNLVMLGSSLACNYDVSQALENISGGIYVYHSQKDLVLQGPVRTLGTIDGQLGVDSAGLVGLHPSGLDTGKIVNIAWQPRHQRFGWTGAHTDATSERFVRAVLAGHILSAEAEPQAVQLAAGVDSDSPGLLGGPPPASAPAEVSLAPAKLTTAPAEPVFDPVTSAPAEIDYDQPATSAPAEVATAMEPR